MGVVSTSSSKDVDSEGVWERGSMGVGSSDVGITVTSIVPVTKTEDCVGIEESRRFRVGVGSRTAVDSISRAVEVTASKENPNELSKALDITSSRGVGMGRSLALSPCVTEDSLTMVFLTGVTVRLNSEFSDRDSENASLM